MTKAKVKVNNGKPAAKRPDPKSYNLNTGVKNVIEIDGLKVHVPSTVYRLLVQLERKTKAKAKPKAKA